MTGEERADALNGIWLCQNCAKRIDNDPVRYTVQMLRSWKADAEADADARLGRPVNRVAATADRWVSLAYVEKAGIAQRVEKEGFRLCWWSANEESEKLDLEGWEHVVVPQQDGTGVHLKIRDHSVIGGYIVLMKKKVT